MGVIKRLQKLLKEVADAPTLETFKVRLNRALNNLVQLEISAHCRWLKLKDL